MAKILLVSNTDWYLYNFRLSLACYLKERGHEVVLVSPPGRFVPLLEKAGFRWVRWDLGRKSLAPWKELASLLKLAFIYRREQPDLIHHHTIKPVIYGSLAARLAGSPAVVNSITGRGYVFLGEDLQAGFLKRIVKPFYRLALASSRAALIFENETDRQYFLAEKLAQPGRTWLIEGVGVDENVFSPSPEPEGPPVVVLAARLLWDKGVGVLVEAARILRSRSIRARVALVGSPDPGNPKSVSEADLRRWEQEGVIEWWGWKDDMRAVYRDCHIVTLPSFGEGVPTSLLEAAACALPIVTTDIPGCRAVVEHQVNGLLVKPGDPKALAQALECLILDASLRGRMGLAGRQIILEKYTNSRVNAATLEVYSSMLKAV